RPPLCGRAAELAALVAAWERANGGRGQIVLVGGEPGEGKPRLIEELVARARLADPTLPAAREVALGREAEVNAAAGLPEAGVGLRLGRLDGTALGALASWALPTYGPAAVERLVGRLERDTAGIPLLAVAMLEAVAGGYKLAPEAPAWPSPQRTLVDSLPNDLPPAVVGVVCMRFRQLPAAAQQVLGAAAALGERVDTAQLATATRLDRI